ncbi:MAG: class I SAM-dependent methyltransferase [Proteobacteria bacterium]|nr:class I SAM-dependent methyltransferase [Pseudomonadota bacterium]
MKIKNIAGEMVRVIRDIAPSKSISQEYEKGHSLYLPLDDYHKYDRNSPDYSPNSVFKIEMLAIREVQEALVEMVSLFPLAGGKANWLSLSPHDWDAEKVRDDCATKLEKYGFSELIDRIQDTVDTRCRPHGGECVLMNGHSYVKMAEAAYTDYITGILPTDAVMNLACGNTYWINVWLANRCATLYVNDNGYDIPLHSDNERVHNYNEYQQGITSNIIFDVFDASHRFPYPDNSFDKTVSHSSVEHIDSWDSNVLPEIIRTLKPGGKCGIASTYHPLGRENLGRGQSSWWTQKKWDRFVSLQEKLGFEIIGNTDYNCGMLWRAEEDTDAYRFGGSVYIVNFIFFKKGNTIRE